MVLSSRLEAHTTLNLADWEVGQEVPWQTDPVPVWLVGHLLADLACHVRLEPTREDLVDDAIAVVRVVGFLPVVIT